MNKKITPRIIRIIALQSIIVMIAITLMGAAINVHNQYINGSGTEEAQAKSDSEVTDTDNNITASNQTQQTTTSTTTAQAENTEYAYAYAGFNPKTTNIGVDITKLIVNTDYALPKDYKPTLAEAVTGSGIQLDYRVAPYYQAMYDAAQSDGITLTPVSGYRSYERQTTNFEEKIQEYIDEGMDKKDATIEAAKTIMLPGSSEHNAGLAMDICSLSESFENTDEFAWLSENAADYGFILRYPKSDEAKEITGVIYEPWHYRYVGVENAKKIKEQGITLEEFLGLA